MFGTRTRTRDVGQQVHDRKTLVGECSAGSLQPTDRRSEHRGTNYKLQVMEGHGCANYPALRLLLEVFLRLSKLA